MDSLDRIERVVLEDFMAHQRTALGLAPGVTVLVGRNNTGKSAVVEALRALTENLPARAAIRHGAKRARVTVELSDGRSIVWTRSASTASYTLSASPTDEASPATEPTDGRAPTVDDEAGDAADESLTFERTRGDVPEEVARALRIGLVENAAGDDVDVHLGNQRSPVFLLDARGSEIASFFAASTEAARLMQLKRLHSRRTTERRNERTRLGRSIEAAERAARPYARLPATHQAIDALVVDHAALEAALAAAPALRAFVESLSNAAAHVRHADRQCRALARVVRPPRLQPSRPLAEQVAQLARARRASARALVEVEALSATPAPPELAQTRGLVDIARRLPIERQRVRRGALIARAVADVPTPPRAEATAPLVKCAADLAYRKREVARLRALAQAYRTMPRAPALEPAGELAGVAQRLADAARREQTLRDQQREATDAVAEATRQVEDLAERLGACPTCGREMTPADVEQLLASRGRGRRHRRDAGHRSTGPAAGPPTEATHGL